MLQGRLRPGTLAAIFAVALALPALGMIIAGLIEGKAWLVFFGLGLFAIMVAIYFVGADVLFWRSEE